MRELERAWDGHREALLVRRDPAAALAPLAAEPSVVHLPAMTGAAGRPAVERFYADQFLPHMPGDLALRTISRIVDRWRLVDETTVSFTQDRVLPGGEPTFPGRGTTAMTCRTASRRRPGRSRPARAGPGRLGQAPAA